MKPYAYIKVSMTVGHFRIVPNHGSRYGPMMKVAQFCCRFEGLTHMGPLEDPVKMALRVTRSFNASQDKNAWAALPVSESVPVQDRCKL